MAGEEEIGNYDRERVTTEAGRALSAIQLDPPSAPTNSSWRRFKKRALRLLAVPGALAGLYLLGVLVGLVPGSYARSSMAGRTISVVSYHGGISSFSTPGYYRTETGGRTVTIQGDVVDLGEGRTVTIPPWCKEVRITVRDGSASVTFPAP